MSEDELLDRITGSLKNRVPKEEVFSEGIKLSNLKKIDEIFNKGLSYYLDPTPPIENKDASIFFRKTTFNTDLNLPAKKIVNQFESFKISLSAIEKMSGVEINRILPKFTIEDAPRDVAIKLRNSVYPTFDYKEREFLKNFINKLADVNILVSEFIEHPALGQANRVNIDGFFLRPNYIVLKRNEGGSFKREIFSLAHELGHYLLDIEEVENVEYYTSLSKENYRIERWCNDFAFNLLIGNYSSLYDSLPSANQTNDYNIDDIEMISKETQLSSRALFTGLLLSSRLEQSAYDKIVKDLEEKAQQEKERLERERQLKREMDKQNGIETIIPGAKPINSPLLISTMKTAFYEGVIDEYQFCKTLKINPDKIGNYLF